MAKGLVSLVVKLVIALAMVTVFVIFWLASRRFEVPVEKRKPAGAASPVAPAPRAPA